MVSIIIPLYNHEQYICKTLDSLLIDDTFDVELIVCDDQSKDNSFEITKNWIERNKKYFKSAVVYQNKNNEGVVRTLNRLLEKSSGEFIFPIASDDLFCKGYIEQRINALKKNDIVINRSSMIDQKGKIKSFNAAMKIFKIPSLNYMSTSALPYVIIMQWSVVGPAPCYRKSVFDRIGFYNETYNVEDREFFLRVVRNNFKIKYIDNNLTKYRVHNENSSRSKMGNFRVRREVSKINIDSAAMFKKNIIISLYLKSYKIDLLLLDKKIYFLYKIFKLFRFVIVYAFMFTFCILSALLNIVIFKK